MSSLAQLTANRRNAALSTGPVTPSGKARSSRNSVGPIAAALVMSGEDQQELADLMDSYLEMVRPLNQVEVDLTIDMAMARWRRSRLFEFEAALLSNTTDKVKAELGPAATRIQIQAIALERLIDGSKTWNTLQRYLKDAERTFNNCLKTLLTAPSRPEKSARKNEPNSVPLPQPVVPTPSRFGPNVPLRPNGYPVNLALAL